MERPVGVGGTLNKEIAVAQMVRDVVERHKLHRPTCAHANVVEFSIIESIPDVLLICPWRTR